MSTEHFYALLERQHKESQTMTDKLKSLETTFAKERVQYRQEIDRLQKSEIQSEQVIKQLNKELDRMYSEKMELLKKLNAKVEGTSDSEKGN
jgi:hypothetical protein